MFIDAILNYLSKNGELGLEQFGIHLWICLTISYV